MAKLLLRLSRLIVLCLVLNGSQAFDMSSCPSWMVEYKTFHDQNRLQPNASYLMYKCVDWCGGAGDRLRGMMFLVKLAALTGRVFLARWESPGPLERWFRPGEIDWRTKALDLSMFAQVPHRRWMNTDGGALDAAGAPLNLRKQSFKDAYKDHRHIIVQTNSIAQTFIGEAPYLNTNSDHDLHCLANMIYRLTRTIDERASTVIKRVYGKANARYVAVHLRMGGLKGEQEVVDRSPKSFNQVEVLLSAGACALNMYNTVLNTSSADAKVLLVTDNQRVRSLVKAGLLCWAAVAPISAAVHHLDTARGSLSQHDTTFVEMALITRATCVITSQSGFSDQGYWMAGHKCRETADRCMANATTTKFRIRKSNSTTIKVS